MDRASIKKDLKFGTTKEKEILPKLQKFFNNNTLRQNKDQYGIIDFIDDDKTLYIELKSRRIRHNQYDSLIIGYNKIIYLENLDIEDKYLVFNCSDGVYYIKYSKELSKLPKRRFHRYDRIASHFVVDIETKLLKKME